MGTYKFSMFLKITYAELHPWTGINEIVNHWKDDLSAAVSVV
jgi:hypothetical protein